MQILLIKKKLDWYGPFGTLGNYNLNCTGVIVPGQIDLRSVSLVMAHENAQQQARANLEEELVDDNFTTTQRLSLIIESLSSTLSFTLETLAQHRTLIEQLQDEVNFLHRQREAMKARLNASSPNSSTQSQNEEVGNRLGSSEDLPDLNVALEPPPDEDLVKTEQ